jgi:predicted DNA-binding protein with PD1-like motif
MLKSILLPVLLSALCSISLFAQQLPGGDVVSTGMMSNNDQVPGVYTVETNFKRVIVVRLKYQQDILEGLNEAVEKENIKNGVILAAIGSVVRYHLHSVNNTTFPPEDIFYEKDEPTDITGMSGYIIDGRVHPHMTLSDEHQAIGGHIEPRTKVFTFCVITIAEFEDGLNLTRVDDSTWR